MTFFVYIYKIYWNSLFIVFSEKKERQIPCLIYVEYMNVWFKNMTRIYVSISNFSITHPKLLCHFKFITPRLSISVTYSSSKPTLQYWERWMGDSINIHKTNHSYCRTIWLDWCRKIVFRYAYNNTYVYIYREHCN